MSETRRMMLGLAVMLLVLLASFSAECKDMIIVEHGQPKATVVISAQENQKVQMAAKDIQDYIQKISGARLPIVSDESNPQGPLILVGRSSLSDKMNVSIPSGLTPARRDEGFIILCEGDRLILAGNNEGPYHGTEYAVYDFLNRLGVRWFMPGEFGEIVPQKKTITFPEIRITQKPDFVLRNWWSMKTPDLEEQESRWKIRNKMNPEWIFWLASDNTIRLVLPEVPHFEERPELFALDSKGVRYPGMPNLSNPETVKVVADSIKEWFKEHPDANSYAFSPDDGIPRDFSPGTVNHGFVYDGGRPGVADEVSISEEWINFANNVTAEVRKDLPDVYISTNGYSNRTFPPQGVELNDHLYIMFANIMGCTRHPYDHPGCWMRIREGQMIQQWCKLCPNVWIYNYIEQMMVSGLTPIPEVHKLRRDMPLLKKWGVMGFHDESRKVLAECGIISRYLRAQLEWDASADVDAILDDYYTQWYGKAAQSMYDFYEAIEVAFDVATVHGHEDRILPEVYTPELMSALGKSLALAEKQADTERTKLHVRVDRLIYDYLKLYVAMSQAEAACDFAAAAKHASDMMELRKELFAINPFLTDPDDHIYVYWGITHRRDYYQSLADLTSGKTGEMVAILPEKAMFKTDPHDDGIFANWHDPDLTYSDWKPISTTRPFYVQGYQDKQGHPYLGYMWYRLDVDVPASAEGKKLMLYGAVVETEAWLWVNGQYIGHRPYAAAYIRPNPLEFDVSKAIRPGKNTIAVRVSTGTGRAQEPSGLLSRLFLYSPIQTN